MTLSLDEAPILDTDGRDWLEITQTDEDGNESTLCSLLIGSSLSPKYKTNEAYYARHLQALSEGAGIGSSRFELTEDHILAFERLDAKRRENVARHLIFDWSGVESGGKEAPYFAESCARLLEQRPEIYHKVLEKAYAIALRLEQRKDETVGKSEPSSSTKRKTHTRKSAAGSARS